MENHNIACSVIQRRKNGLTEEDVNVELAHKPDTHYKVKYELYAACNIND